MEEFLNHRGRSFNMTSILQGGLIVGGKDTKEERKRVFSTPLEPFEDETFEEFANDSPRSRKVHFYSKYKPHQHVVYWTHQVREQEKGLEFWQTRSHVIILYDSADCIEKVVSLQGEKTLNQRVSTPRPAPKIVHKDA